MELIIENIKSGADKKLLVDIAKRLGLSSKVLTKQEKEDIALAKAIDEGRKSGYEDEKTVLKTLNNISGK